MPSTSNMHTKRKDSLGDSAETQCLHKREERNVTFQMARNLLTILQQSTTGHQVGISALNSPCLQDIVSIFFVR
jgi:hypothetical protein